jgi:hypothetical protein
MAIPNRVSATLSQEDQEALLSALATIRQKLPFLLGLNPDERHALPIAQPDLSRSLSNSASPRVAPDAILSTKPSKLPRGFGGQAVCPPRGESPEGGACPCPLVPFAIFSASHIPNFFSNRLRIWSSFPF